MSREAVLILVIPQTTTRALKTSRKQFLLLYTITQMQPRTWRLLVCDLSALTSVPNFYRSEKGSRSTHALELLISV